MNEKEINIQVIGERSRKTILVSREPLNVTLLSDVNAIIDPKIIKKLTLWLDSVTLEEAAKELDTSITWCFNLKKEIQELQELQKQQELEELQKQQKLQEQQKLEELQELEKLEELEELEELQKREEEDENISPSGG